MVDSKSPLQSFAERWFAPAALVISGIASGFSYLAQRQSDAAAHEAEKAREAATAAKDQAAQNALQRDYAFRVSQLVLTSISDADVRKQQTLLALVDTVDEPFRTKLALALSQAGQASVQQDAKALLAFVQQDRADKVAPAASGAAGQAPARTVAATASVAPGTQQLASYKAGGFDIDIFWCQGGDADAARQARAQGFAEALARLSKANQKLDGNAIGRVRVRPLSAVINARPGYGISGDILRPDADERRFAESLARLAAQGGTPLAIGASGQRTQWYMSAFFCK